MSKVTNTHPDYDRSLYTWWWMRHAVKGDVKGDESENLSFSSGAPGRVVANGYTDSLDQTYNVREAFLPSEWAVTDPDYYLQYVRRAYWLGATGQARKALVGMVFAKPLTYEVPQQLEPLLENFDGAGNSVTQVCKLAEREILTTGRFGLFVDYPQGASSMTIAEEAALGIRPYAATYTAENIINWRSDIVGGSPKLTLIVLREPYNAAEDEFSHSTKMRYRVLRLRDGVYTQELYDDKGDVLIDEYAPLAGGQVLDHIPFYLVGSEDNLPDVDDPVLKPIADVNAAHYQVTADNMENLHIHGQLTIGFTTDADQEQFSKWNPDGVKLGARVGHYLGTNGAFHQLTAPESSSLSAELERLEQRMIYLGAKLVQRGGQAETAEAARIDAAAEQSVLDTTVDNLSDAIESCLEDMARFVNADPEEVSFTLNKDYVGSTVTAQLATAIGVLKNSSLISTDDAIDMIRRGRIEISGNRTNEDIKEAIADELVGDLTNGDGVAE
jgi:hypothetical protein